MRTARLFNLLEASPEENKRRKISLALGCAVEVAAMGLVGLLGVLFPYKIQPQVNTYKLITLTFPVDQKPALKVPPPPKPRAIERKIEPPQPLVPHIEAPALAHAPQVESPKIQAALPVRNIPQQPQPMPETVAPPIPTVARAIHTGLFGQAADKSGGEKVSLEHVQTGGFGSPEGLPGQARAGNPGNVPKLGAFDLPEGPGRGNGTGGLQGSARVVASAGFGDGGVGNEVGREPGGAAPGAVRTGAFGFAPESAQAPEKRMRPDPPAPEVRPVEILSKPTPQYTEEARQLRVQGEVVLSVVFQANGTLKVLGVVKSLGHGLDRMAEQAASQIRFKPAEQAGRPTDFPATLRIEFRLA